MTCTAWSRNILISFTIISVFLEHFSFFITFKNEYFLIFCIVQHYNLIAWTISECELYLNINEQIRFVYLGGNTRTVTSFFAYRSRRLSKYVVVEIPLMHIRMLVFIWILMWILLNFLFIFTVEWVWGDVVLGQLTFIGFG